MELLFLVLFSLHILKTEAVVGGHWCYQSQKYEQPHCEDPRQWHLIDVTCKGNKQSPINIVTKNVVYEKDLKPLNFEGYDVKGSSKWNIENNGHTVKVTLSTTPKIGGGGLGRKYKAIEFHLHWGVQGVQQYLPGSEHSIDGEKQAMELHIVHIRDDVSDIKEAKKNPAGVAVLAFFIKGKQHRWSLCHSVLYFHLRKTLQSTIGMRAPSPLPTAMRASSGQSLRSQLNSVFLRFLNSQQFTLTGRTQQPWLKISGLFSF
ncbi:carbonic anhydrase 4 isoform X2 [Phalacrocorax carbo]|uniref:carbonic anhydrase 4 isoform X2 n=1 Tax=Phalacrocorax carbo TaxID=9209 RepID=UPI00311972BA